MLCPAHNKKYECVIIISHETLYYYHLDGANLTNTVYTMVTVFTYVGCGLVCFHFLEPKSYYNMGKGVGESEMKARWEHKSIM